MIAHRSISHNQKIWKIVKDEIFIIGETCMRICSEGTVNNESEFITLAHSIYAIDKNTGELSKINDYPYIDSKKEPSHFQTKENTNINPGYAASNLYNYGRLSYGCGDNLVYICDTDDPNRSVFFTTYFDTDIQWPDRSSKNLLAQTYGYRAGFVQYDINDGKFHKLTDTAFKCELGNNVKRANLINPMSYPAGDLILSHAKFTYPLHPFKVTSSDKTIKDTYTLYSCWGNLWADTCDDSDTHFREIYKFQYNPKNQESLCAPMTVYNQDGSARTKKDWFPYDTSTDYTKYTNLSIPYLVYFDDAKYLVIYDFMFTLTGEINRNDSLGHLWLFKFIDNDTLQEVDRLDIAASDVFWIKDNVLIMLRNDIIRFVKIDKEADNLEIIRSIVPHKDGNLFVFSCIDDMQTFWYAEAERNSGNGYYNSLQMNYINDYIVDYINIEREKVDYIYDPLSEDDLISYIDVSCTSAYGEYLEREINVNIVGNAVFEETRNKTVKFTSSSEGPTRIPFIIRGIGETTFSASLVKTN